MQHWEITDKRIYQLLKHPYQLDKSIVEDMTSAYLEFVEELFECINDLKDNKILIRKLNTAYLEFATIKAFFLSDVARIFEKMFNVSFGDIYKKEIAVIKRKPTKVTEFLDRLKAVIIQKSKNDGYGKSSAR